MLHKAQTAQCTTPKHSSTSKHLIPQSTHKSQLVWLHHHVCVIVKYLWQLITVCALNKFSVSLLNAMLVTCKTMQNIIKYNLLGSQIHYFTVEACDLRQCKYRSCVQIMLQNLLTGQIHCFTAEAYDKDKAKTGHVYRS